jgi:hypothetical protein
MRVNEAWAQHMVWSIDAFIGRVAREGLVFRQNSDDPTVANRNCVSLEYRAEGFDRNDPARSDERIDVVHEASGKRGSKV